MTTVQPKEQRRLANDSSVGRRWERVIGHPAAFAATTLLLFGLFGWTFLANQDRVAPTKDPAYYTWRTEALITEEPETLLRIEGAFEMFAGGYRVSAPIIGGYLRQIPELSSLTVTVVMMVALPVLIALLLATFAYGHRRDPLIWHSVALGSASLFLTPPFVGYLDNMLCLFFLAASLLFIEGTRASWRSRVAFGVFLLLSGLTHPTTLAIFCLTLGAMATIRLLFRRFDFRSVLRDDGPMLGVAFGSAVITYAIWKVGIWGINASLSEAALPPPYGSDFFVDRMVGWLDAMRLALNGPLLLIGAAGLLVVGRRAVEDELARTTIVWLAPLAGIFGFVAGLTYPYYRFFNTTLAWVLLIGLGIFFAARFFAERAAAGGIGRLALLGVFALGVIVATNFSTGYDVSGWNNPSGGWLSASERRDLDALRAVLATEDPDRPVVFVIDDEPPAPFQIWGFTKLSGNTSRYGLPEGQIDRGYLYLGDLDNFFAGEPTTRGEETYDKLSPALLEDAERGIEASGLEPIVVVASAFNPAGANVDIATAADGPRPDENVWVLNEGAVIGGDDSTVLEDPAPSGGGVHLVRVFGGLILLLLPGVFALRFFLPGAGMAEGLGIVPALAVAIETLVAIIVLAVGRVPFSTGVAWAALIGALLIGAALSLRSRPAPTA